jgi:hypothetical protein
MHEGPTVALKKCLSLPQVGKRGGTDGERLIHTPIGLLEARDDTRVRLKDPFAQTCDVIDGFIVELRTKRPK